MLTCVPHIVISRQHDLFQGALSYVLGTSRHFWARGTLAQDRTQDSLKIQTKRYTHHNIMNPLINGCHGNMALIVVRAWIPGYTTETWTQSSMGHRLGIGAPLNGPDGNMAAIVFGHGCPGHDGYMDVRMAMFSTC